MILAALNDYYQRLLSDPDSGIAQPGYSREKISYAILLDKNGHVVDVNDLREQQGKKSVARLLSVPQPEKRTAGVKSNFLWDKTSYVLGVSATSKRSAQEHVAFKDLHKAALAGTDDPGLKALLAFLDGWTPAQFDTNRHFQQQRKQDDETNEMLDANVVFRLDGEQEYLHERPAARAAWDRLQNTSSDATQGICLVTGEKRAPIARLHPAIKGVDGAQTMGASIVSFNLEAFSSYGKSQGENAPVSEQAAFAYTTALNHLLRRSEHNRQRVQIGDTTVVFWAQAPERANAEAAEKFFAEAFSGADDERATGELNRALNQVRQGLPLRALGSHLDEGTRIFVLGLAPNASRLSIRFWETGTLKHFAKQLADHYGDLALEPVPWKRPPTPYLLALTTAPWRDNKYIAKDVSPLLAGELTRAILTGARYPRSILAALVMRFRADGNITDLRVALCKAVLARDARLGNDNPMKEVRLVSLDLNNTDPGYRLGRLFSTLENVQRVALGQVNATIRDRYYGAASATPASIFPVLLRNAQNHLSKLRKEKPGLAVVQEKEIGQIIDALAPNLPRSLGIEEQGRFAIGYYHQTQARFAGNDSPDEDQNATDTDSEGEQE